MQKISDGAYLLSQVTITENGETTVKLRDQIKIYSKGKFMFAFDNESTGDMDVGAGNATWVDGIMVEEPLVNHDGPLSDLSFDITIEPTEIGFDQVLHGMKYDDGRVLDTMVEVWKRAPGKPSPYDGLWKLENRQVDNPELTEFTETKMIGGGHFIILQSAVYQGKKVRNFGFALLICKMMAGRLKMEWLALGIIIQIVGKGCIKDDRRKSYAAVFFPRRPRDNSDLCPHVIFWLAPLSGLVDFCR